MYFIPKNFIIPQICFHSLSLFRHFLYTFNLYVLLFFMIESTNTCCFIIQSASFHRASFTSSYISSFLSSSFHPNMREHQDWWLCLHYLSAFLDGLLCIVEAFMMIIKLHAITFLIMYMSSICISLKISWIIERHKRKAIYPLDLTAVHQSETLSESDSEPF